VPCQDQTQWQSVCLLLALESVDGAIILGSNQLSIKFPPQTPMKSSLALSALLILSPFATGSAQVARSLSVAEVVRQNQSAVVLVRTFDQAGRSTSLGSGFILPDGRVVTNSHVLAGGARAEIFGADGQLLLTTDVIEAYSSSVDIAILPRVPDPPGRMTLSRIPPSVGDQVVVIGAPEGLANTVTEGIISAFRTNGPQRLLQISAPISPGSSGGPVLNTMGEVVGVSVSQLREGQNLNFAIPIPEVRALAGSPAGRYSFPGSVAVATRTTSIPPSVEPSPPPPAPSSPSAGTRQQVRHFALDLDGCVNSVRGLVCVLRVSNVDPSGSANRHFYLESGAVYVNGYKLEPTNAMLGSKSGNIRGIAMLDEQIPPAVAMNMAILFPQVVPGTRQCDLQLQVSIGMSGGAQEVWFRGVAIQAQ
jgi:S1-C subfamily serine protease